MPSLHAAGWRQGSLVDADIPMGGLVFGSDGGIQANPESHRAWVVASQDCDLDGWDTTDQRPLVELRPRQPVDRADLEWGIRSRVLRLSETEAVSDEWPPVRVPPAMLVAFGPPGGPITPTRAVAFKTWLGRRYDRPAVPAVLVDLAMDIAVRAQRRSQRPFTEHLHDVLMQFDERSTPPTFHLFAVIADGADREAARRWLTEVGIAVKATLGVLGGVDVGTRAETSLELMETSFSADLSRLSWSGPVTSGPA